VAEWADGYALELDDEPDVGDRRDENLDDQPPQVDLEVGEVAM
jgi:hypothetical protein